MNKRLLISIISGAILGVFCILGANLRFNGELSRTFLFAFWFNRLLMGIVIGLINQPLPYTKRLIRGFIIGIIVSFAFYSATDFQDLLGFLVGGVYGVIIEIAAYSFTKPLRRR